LEQYEIIWINKLFKARHKHTPTHTRTLVHDWKTLKITTIKK